MSTRAEIATAAREYLDEINAGVTVTGTIMTNAINRSQRELNRITEYNRLERTITTTTSTREYTMTGTHTKIYRVRYGPTYKKLDPTSVARLDNENPGWEGGTAGTPSGYYAHGPKFGLQPKPDATGTVYYNTLVTPANLSASGSSPSWCPNEYHDTLAKGVAIDLAGGQLATTDSSQNRAGWLYSQYMRDAQEMKRLAVRRSAEYTGGFKPTGYERFRR